MLGWSLALMGADCAQGNKSRDVGERPQGRRDHLPIHDATLCNADDVFALLEKYIVEAGIVEAKEIIFVADGAHWIWDRVDKLVHKLQIDRRKVTQVIDFYHACEHISAALEAIPDLSDSKRKRLFLDLRSFLAQGRVQVIVEQIPGAHTWKNHTGRCREGDTVF